MVHLKTLSAALAGFGLVTVAVADPVSVTVTSGDAGIHALAATYRLNDASGAGDNFGAYSFTTFSGDSNYADINAVLAAARATSNFAQAVNPTNGAWAPNGSLNASSVWVHSSSDSIDGQASNTSGTRTDGVSVMYALPFSGLDTARDNVITVRWYTDNGLGDANGHNGGFQPGSYNGIFATNNDGTTFTDAGYASNAGNGQPAEFSGAANVQQFFVPAGFFTSSSINYVYLYEFNWGGPGASQFEVNITAIPLPSSALAGGAGLLAVASLGVIRRRRHA